MRKKWVIIRIETKVREFYSKSFLAYHLVNMGYGIILENELGGQVHRFPKGLYLINSMYKNTYSRIRDIAKKGNVIYMLDEEGLVMINKNKYLSRIDKRSMKYITKFLCYGSNQYNILHNEFTSYANKFVITGNPRLNLLNEEFADVEKSNIGDLKKQYGDYILIVSNFSFVNMFGSDVSKDERYKRVRNQLDEMRLLNDVDDFNKQFDYYNQLFESFIQLVSILGKKYPNINIIVRPHPSEDIKIWKKIESEYRNIKVIHKGPLTRWIKDSKLVIQNSCTSAIECLYLNKACISYRPIRNDKYDQPLPNLLSINVDSVDKVVEVINKTIVTDDNIFKEEYKHFKKIAQKYISFQEKDASVKEILRLISNERIEEDNYYKFKYDISKYNLVVLYRKFKKFIKISGAFFIYNIMTKIKLKKNYLYSFLDRKLSLLNVSIEYNKNKIGNISVHEINEIFNSLNKIYAQEMLFNIEKLDNNVFMITKSN